eukprot:6033137-Pyramimonas_sp.AAC.1
MRPSIPARRAAHSAADGAGSRGAPLAGHARKAGAGAVGLGRCVGRARERDRPGGPMPRGGRAGDDFH